MRKFMKPTIALVALALTLVPARADTVAAGCSWPVRGDVDVLNVAFPDDAAIYYLLRFESIPGTHLQITGKFPDARYISYHAYDEAQRPVDGLADVDIDADPGQPHFFRDQTAQPGGTYRVTVQFTAEPAVHPANTLYAGGMQEGTPNPSGAILYRIYVPTDPADLTGGVGVPDVTLVGPEGSVELAFEQCEPLPPSAGGEVNDAVRASSFPNQVPRAVPFPSATNPPTFGRFYGIDRLAYNRVPPNSVTDSLPRTQGGFLSNEHNAYLTSRLSRNFGDLVVMRFRAPTFPDNQAGEPVADPRQLRYWSICQNEFVSQRVVECLTDYEAVVGDDGYGTLVISDPDDRPANATTAAGVNWLAWGGPYYDGTIIYRHMLPASSFPEAIQNIPEGTDAASVMQTYMPVARYCAPATFQAGGWQACFA